VQLGPPPRAPGICQVAGREVDDARAVHYCHEGCSAGGGCVEGFGECLLLAEQQSRTAGTGRRLAGTECPGLSPAATRPSRRPTAPGRAYPLPGRRSAGGADNATRRRRACVLVV
jgi:hypothetical protein